MVLSSLFKRRTLDNATTTVTTGSETKGLRNLLIFRKRRQRHVTVLPLAGNTSSNNTVPPSVVVQENENPALVSSTPASLFHSISTPNATNIATRRSNGMKEGSVTSPSVAQAFWGHLQQKNPHQQNQLQRWTRRRRCQRRYSVAETVDGSSASSSAWYPTGTMVGVTNANAPSVQSVSLPFPPVEFSTKVASISTITTTATSSTTLKASSRCVSFHDYLDVREIAPRSAYTEEQKQEMWVQPEEYHQIRARIRRVLEYAEEHPEPHKPGTRKICLRGLESMRATKAASSSTWFDVGGARVHHHHHHHMLPNPTRMRGWESVLDEQDRQRVNGVRDEEALALAYQTVSLPIAAEAQARAISDVKVIKAYLRRRSSVGTTTSVTTTTTTSHGDDDDEQTNTI